MTEKPPKLKIICLKRKTRLNLSPARWLSVVEKAADSPEKAIKRDGLKRTVATALAPWGRVCLQDRDWGARKSVLSLLRPNRGRLAWKHCLALLKLGVPITEPLLYLELKNGPFISRTFTVTKWIEGENIGKTARNKDSIPEGKLIEILKRASALAATFHAEGFVHGDLKWSNFLWSDGSPPQIFLSDLDHVERTGAAEKQGKDLARFVLSALEFGLGWDVANLLVDRYFRSRSLRPVGFEKYMNKHIERKRKKYENRATLYASKKADR